MILQSFILPCIHVFVCMFEKKLTVMTNWLLELLQYRNRGELIFVKRVLCVYILILYSMLLFLENSCILYFFLDCFG